MTATLPEAPATPETERYVPALAITTIRESKLNPRTHFDPAALKELAASLKAKGQLQPVLVRPISDGRPGKPFHYELAAGHRRYRAAKLAGITALAAIVRPMNDTEFTEVITFENLQREDLLPLEEAAGYAALLKLPGYDVAGIAAKIGKSESYVHRRLALQKLTPASRKALEEDRIQVGHAEILARLPEPEQGKALQWCVRSWGDTSVKQLREYVAHELLLQLKGVPWKLDDTTMPGGACSSCPKRTGATPALFEDLARDDRCLDHQCYDTKCRAALGRKRDQLNAEGAPFVQISREYGKTEKGVLGPYQYREVPKSAKGATKALVVDGRGYGSTTWVSTESEERSQGHGGNDSYRKEQQRKIDAAKRTTEAHLAAVVEAVGGEQSFAALAKVPELPMIATGLVAEMSGDAAMRLKKLGKELPWLPAKLADRPRCTKALAIVEAMPGTDRARLVMLLTLLPYVGVSAWYSAGSESLLPPMLAALGVDVKAHVKRVADAHRTKQAAKKAKATKAKGAKKGAKKRAGDVARNRRKKQAGKR